MEEKELVGAKTAGGLGPLSLDQVWHASPGQGAGQAPHPPELQASTSAAVVVLVCTHMLLVNQSM